MNGEPSIEITKYSLLLLFFTPFAFNFYWLDSAGAVRAVLARL